MNKRTPQDYAIEHAGYLADAAKDYMIAVGAVLVAQMDDGEDDTPETQEALEAASEAMSEAGSRLAAGIYEFEKRRDRAAAALAGDGSGHA